MDKSCICSAAKVNFPELCFDKEGVYTFTIAERPNKKPCCKKHCCCCCWKFDCRVYRAIITISRDKNGSLVSEVEYPDGLPTFVNKCCCCCCKK